MERLAQAGPVGAQSDHAATVEHDAASLSRALVGVARAGDLETKALFFAAAAEQMTALRELPSVTGLGVVHTGAHEAAGHVRIGLTHVVHSDTTGVMRELAFQKDNEGGQQTVAYVEALLDPGQTDSVRATLDRLQRGNTRQETADACFGREGELAPTQAQKDNATALGQYVGLVGHRRVVCLGT